MDRRAQLCFGSGQVTALGQERAEVHSRFGSVRVVTLDLDVLGGRAIEPGLLLRTELLWRHGGQETGGLDANGHEPTGQELPR